MHSNYANLLKEAQRNPWGFFKTHPIKEILVAVHPDRNGGTTNELFAQFQEAHRRSESPLEYCESFPLYREIALGDLRRVYLSEDCVIKIPRTTNNAAKRLIQKEVDLLDEIENRYNKTVFLRSFPQNKPIINSNNKRATAVTYEFGTISQALAKIDGVHISWMTKRLLGALGAMHNMGWSHCAITPEHVMFTEGHDCVLFGFIHSQKHGEKIISIPASRKDWYPSVAKDGASPSVDLMMASKLMLSLCDKDVPKRLVSFIKGLSFTKKDPWDLVDDLDIVLRETYGPPKYVPFSF